MASTSLAEPFLTQDQNPFSLINGQPQPMAARLPSAGAAHNSISLDITNTLNLETASGESLLLDYESYLLRFGLIVGLANDWAILLDVPLIDRRGGFLDGPIDSWHRTFGLSRADRPNVADDQFRITYTNNNATEYDTVTPEQGLGDIQIGLGHQFYQSDTGAGGIWLIADLPTGERDKLTGNDALDISLQLTGSYRIDPEWSTNSNLGALFPGNNTFGTLEAEDIVLFGHAGISWTVHPAIDIKIQFSGHTQHYSDSSLALLGSAYNITFGGSIHLDNCSRLDLAVSEDIKVGATPDVSFLFSWFHKTGDCSKQE